MSTLLTLRMLSDEDDHFLRDYRIPYDLSLIDLHRFICKDLAYDPDEMASFFTSDREWSRVRELTLMDMEVEPQTTENTSEGRRLCDILTHLHDRLIYLFDLLNDRAYYLEVVAADEVEEANPGPDLLLSHGEAPDQFDADLSPSNRSIFEEAMSDYGTMDDYEEGYGDDEF